MDDETGFLQAADTAVRTPAGGDDRPSLGRDPAFIGMTVTQFLGAFNDNLYKQLLLLIALDYKELRGLDSDPFQATVTLAFSIPFILFSGMGGFISDRLRKRSVIVSCKALEILVMLAAFTAFLTGTMGATSFFVALTVVLFFMGTQSALFGPSKFGILPEMLREKDLPTANGIIQMTTFLAIIFGTAVSGLLKEALPGKFWLISVVCICIAIVGTWTSMLVRRSPVARPDLKFSWDCLLIEKSAFHFLKTDRRLGTIILIGALFWFAGAVVLQSVNLVGKKQLMFSDTTTSLLSTCMGIGIAIGCVLCGKLSQGVVRFDLVRLGAVGLSAATLLLSVVCLIPVAHKPTHAMLMGSALLLTGLFAGLFAVPLQVFTQLRPPESLKGRVIGAMNLIVWIGIAAASPYYLMFTIFTSKAGLDYSWLFLSVGLVFVPVAIWFRPPNPRCEDVQLNDDFELTIRENKHA